MADQRLSEGATPQIDADRARFRTLVERIASWTDAEVACVSPGQVRHVAQLVLDGAGPTYPPFADPTRKHEDTEVARLREHIAEQIIHVGNRIQDGRDLGETVWRLALEDVVRENRAVLASGRRATSSSDLAEVTGRLTKSQREAWINTVLAVASTEPQRMAFIAGYNGGEFPKPRTAVKLEMYELGRAVSMYLNQDTDNLARRWPEHWQRAGLNGAFAQAIRALRFLAHNDRPSGGEQFPNSACCHQIADELELTRRVYAAALAALPLTSQQDRYLVWSNEHRAWWKPAHHGYTRRVEDAGRYDRAEAMSIASRRGGGWPIEENPFEIAILEADAVEQAAAPRPARAERNDA